MKTMNDNFEQIIKEARKVDLNKREKFLLRSEIVRFVTLERPLPQRSFLGFKVLFHKSAVLLLAVALVVVGGVAYGAEASLPGDLLYPVKINVNENARALITFSPEAKANWEVRRAERRLEEAERLAADNRLDEKTEAQLAANFEKHAQRAEKLGATDLVISLRAHEVVLEKLTSNSSLLASVKEKKEKEIEKKISKVRQFVEDSAVGAAPAAMEIKAGLDNLEKENKTHKNKNK